MENQLNGAVTNAKKNIPSASQAKGTVKNMAQEATTEFKSLSEIKSLDDVKAFAESILGGSFENVDEVKAQIRKSVDEIQVRATEYSKTAVSYVKRNPGIFAALAAGIALWFVSSLFRGSKKA